ncbi:hypothetical protein EVJ58_g1659 [Rhodofomes roseus]|uniref:4-hydroxybenzoate polyprenyltransferase n=1 Tax=Rhodofomes roseus TaxID=34475 RepID=A0A4Y9YYD9_9APHY|nr:hypothetical protein EVJ58_g1659 [Rhodofomes roseus]
MSAEADKKTPLLNKQAPSAGPAKPQFKLYWELARMHKFPAGTNLVFWPSVWGYLLGTRENPPDMTTLARYTMAFLVAATLLHSAACTINDICDRDFDRQVERCKHRPIASGGHGLPGDGFSSHPGRHLRVDAGTSEPHGLPLWDAWLGFAMNWGFPTAWLIAKPEDIKSIPLWALTLGTVWLVDRKDDVEAGVKSTALLFGAYVKPILSVFGAVFIGTLAYVGMDTSMALPYFVLGVGGCALHMVWQLGTLDVSAPEDCWKKFKSNGHLGLIVAAGMSAAIYSPDLLKV